MACSCVEVSIYILVTSIMIIKTELYIMTMDYNISLYEHLNKSTSTLLQVSEFLRMMMMFGGIGPGTPDVFRTINPDPHKVSMKKYMYTKSGWTTTFVKVSKNGPAAQQLFLTF